MRQWILWCACAWLCLGGLVAQDFEAGLAAAQARIEAKEWRPALDVLLTLPERVELAEDREVLSAWLREVGDRLFADADFEAALRARSTGLATLLILHGDLDHADVALGQNNVAYCLLSLGRPAEALALFEQTLAMQRRLHGDRDHPDVAAALNNLAACLRSLARNGEALPMFEQALAMHRRLNGDRDHANLAVVLHSVAGCLQLLERTSEALPMFEQALAVRRRLNGDRDHPDVTQNLNAVGVCLESLGRAGEALPLFEQALAMWKRLYGDHDHLELAASLNHVASCLQALGRAGEALPLFEQALAMNTRLRGDRDHPDIANSLNNLAGCLQLLGRASEALPQFEKVLAMRKRLCGNRDHPDVAGGVNNVASSLEVLGRSGEALPMFEQALAMRRRLHGDRDHSDIAMGLNNLAYCLGSLGRAREALPQYQQALAMNQRLHGERDHPGLASSLNSVAACLHALGRAGEALPWYEQALAMNKRLYGERDHPDIALGLGNLADCLQSLGRGGEALPQHKQALAMRSRLYGDRDHPDVAQNLNKMAVCLQSLGRAGEALPLCEEAVAMQERLCGDRDHPAVAESLNNVALCLESLGRHGEALARYEQALAMWRRVHGNRDHPDVALGLHNVAGCLRSLGRAGEALLHYELTLPMRRRLYGDRDHPDVVKSLSNVVHCLEALGRTSEALLQCEAAVAMIERIRDDTRLSPELRQSLFEDMKSRGAFERLQVLTSREGRATDALLAAERSRGRGLLDQLAQTGDPVAEAQRRARLRGDEPTAARLGVLRADIDAAHATDDRLLHEMTTLANQPDVPDRESRRTALLAHAIELTARLRQLLDERARLLGAELPVGRVRTGPEVQAVLQPKELLLEFTITRDVALLYVLAHEGALEVLELPNAFKTVRRALPGLLQRSSHGQLRGRDPEIVTSTPDTASTDLFASLIPAPLWERLRTSRRVFVAAHRELHLLPFELLVTAVKDGKATWWLDEGPPTSYVPSGTMLHWLRQRANEAGDDTTSLDLLAVGDPSNGAQRESSARTGDLERIRQLPPLRGARAEAEAISKMFADKKAEAKRLLGADATESAVGDLASRAEYLHFACHGIAEEYAGQSLSMLVLAQTQHVFPGDDGLLKLADLWNNWRGRLSSCRLVVLSACRTNVGPTLRDEAPQALPIGFFFAGVPSVISSLWAVDDASTKELMIDFYGRLLAGETDKLKAFTDSKKALRAKYPDPFHWAPFLFLGAPE